MKTIGIVAVRRETAIFLKQQLDDLFSNIIRVNPYILSEIEGQIQIKEESLLVFAGRDSFDMAKIKIIADCDRILANRSVNYEKLNEVFRIPAKTKVFLLNDFYTSAMETIEYLQALGIDQLEYEPLYPGAPINHAIKVLITVGEHDLIPKRIKQVIDIGIRTIDISTIIEILLRLDIPGERLGKYTTKYIQDIIELIKAVHVLNNQNEYTKNRLETIVSSVDEGIITIDGMERISVFSDTAKIFFDCNEDNLVGTSVEQLCSTKGKKFEFLKANIGGSGKILQYKDRKVLITSTNIPAQNGETERMYIIKEITEIQRLEQKIRMKIAPKRYIAQYDLDDIIGESEAVQKNKAMVRKIAQYDSPVYIYGESGTGKELFAQAIHSCSKRKDGPFVAVNFAAMSESLLESELFGYAEGAFTGAKKGGTPGIFEQAHGGTLFLDEIGDSPLSFQVKLLRVLQEKQVRRIGDDKMIPVNVRVIVATNKNIENLVKKGQFREDLYYRINVLPLYLQPLRERREDILPLASTFYHELTKGNRDVLPFDVFLSNVKAEIVAYDFPGNIRQLRNVIEYLLCTVDRRAVLKSDLPMEFQFKSTQTMSNDFLQSEENLQIVCLHKVLEREKRGTVSGRRSLAKELFVSEEKIKKVLRILEEKGYIEINHGRKGIKLTKKGIEKVENGI